jgi:hypothetical protein
MHLWPNKSITKASTNWKLPNSLKNIPKGMDRAVWEKQIKDFKTDKLIALDQLPKASKRISKTGE